jgi:hypothetical protein
LHTANFSESAAQRRSVGTFVGMLLHNGAQR